jgi:hypothetical protein
MFRLTLYSPLLSPFGFKSAQDYTSYQVRLNTHNIRKKEDAEKLVNLAIGQRFTLCACKAT